VDGSPEVVAELDFPTPSASPVGLFPSAEGSSLGLSERFEGVDAAVSLTAVGASAIVTSVAAERGGTEVEVLLVGESSEVDAVPVLARLWCFCCSVSDGDRDRLRFASASGMANLVYGYFLKVRRIGRFKACYVGGERRLGIGILNKVVWSDGGSGDGGEGDARMEEASRQQGSTHTLTGNVAKQRKNQSLAREALGTAVFATLEGEVLNNSES